MKIKQEMFDELVEELLNRWEKVGLHIDSVERRRATGEVGNWAWIAERTLAKIIKLAEEFEWCPHCGNHELKSSHFCDKCKERMVAPNDAQLFAEYLTKMIRQTEKIKENYEPL